MQAIKKFDDFIEKFFGGILVASVFGMLLFSVFSIVLRWFNTSYLWIEPLVRHLVFLSAFLGGVIATGRGSHIAIDIIGKYFESKKNERAMLLLKRISAVVSCIVLVWLVLTSVEFIKMEFKYGKEVFWGIHSGFLVSIIPAGFSIIAIRFLNVFLLSFSEENGKGE